MARLGFGRGQLPDPRLPPGQYDTGSSFPVLTAEVSPKLTAQNWSFRVDGLVQEAKTWDWQAAHKLEPSSYEGDIHCVTSWSKLGTSFSGVSLDTFLESAGVLPEATHVVAWSHTGYTTNLPLAEVTGGRAWLVWDHEGKPLPPEHGGPVRMLVPHLYFWKSAKWIGGLRLLDHDEPGFWEQRGYHELGDPWLEQRYSGD
ncbi:sulfite oxidase-like oxidoreductase [Kineosporia rhizophila]|uniref:sulfite oxidase-like oxidoreductase n=1 Tax=Kineosporia TaxID=49184 RepID=UPI000A3FE9B1|nr:MULTISPECIES: sulfite oxidase-like oxidoreductase [Kineosporia]MCE0533897.1 sulfite oxidase-like oxidoreductase [Kineosporia rhizophila]GLY13436.1 molybdopterin-binding protein [Kineosporia sp. NBRC 101677]